MQVALRKGQQPALSMAVGTSLCCSRCSRASVGDGRGDKMSVSIWPCTDSNKTSVSERVPQHGLSVGPTVKDGKCVKFCSGLKNQILGALLLVWTPPPPEDLCYLCMFPLRVHVSYTCAEVLPISFYRPSPVWIENYCVSEELLDLVFIAAEVLFTLLNEENLRWLRVMYIQFTVILKSFFTHQVGVFALM